MDGPPSLTFQPIRNGDRSTFPSFADEICFMDGHPDLLRIWNEKTRRDEIACVGTFRNGKEHKLIETDVPKDRSWLWHCNGNAISITHCESNTGTAIFYEDGSFRTQNVPQKKLEGLHCRSFIRAGSNFYFVYGEKIIASNLPHAPLLWKFRPGNHYYSVKIVGRSIAICQMFDESSSVIMYELDNGAYRERRSTSVPFKAITLTTLGDNYVVFLGVSELAVIDCTRKEAVRFTFSQVTGTIILIAARFLGDDSMEIYFSTSHEDRCRIYKTSLSLEVLKTRFGFERNKGNLDHSNRPRTPELRRAVAKGESRAAQDKEIAETKEKMAQLESTVVEEKRENAQLKETVSTLQARLEALEKKYTTVLLMAAKK